MIPLTNYDFQWGRSEVVMKFTQMGLRSIHGTSTALPRHFQGLVFLTPELRDVKEFLPGFEGLTHRQHRQEAQGLVSKWDIPIYTHKIGAS